MPYTIPGFSGGIIPGPVTFSSAVTFDSTATFNDQILLPGSVDVNDVITIAAGDSTADITLTLLASATTLRGLQQTLSDTSGAFWFGYNVYAYYPPSPAIFVGLATSPTAPVLTFSPTLRINPSNYGYNFFYTSNGLNQVAASGTQYSWTSVVDAAGGSIDTGLARSSAGVVKVTDGSTGTGHLLIPAGGNLYIGTDGGQITQNTAGTPDQSVLATGTTSNAWLIAEAADIGFDFAHAAATDPTLFIHSHNQSTTQWISAMHDGSNGGWIQTGAGNLYLSPATSLVSIPSASIGGDNSLYFGGTSSAFNQIGHRTAGTPDQTVLATGTTSNAWIIAESADIAFDFAHAAATNPTLFIHSANQSTTQWVGITHNAAHPTITSGLGPVALHGGATVASDTALPLPTGNVFHVSGTTDITSITSTNFTAGIMITLIFDGVLTFTDGNNLKLNGNFTTSADDTITLVYDGSNWYEVARSAN